jgi:hypothetical protein
LTLSERTSVHDQRCKLQSQITVFNLRSQVFLGKGSWDELEVQSSNAGLSNTIDNSEDSDEEDDFANVNPEHAILCMPSTLGVQQCLKHGLGAMVDQERELRVGEANESLEKLRLALGHKAMLLRNPVRNATGQKSKTRAWEAVTLVQEKAEREVAVYHQAREALVGLEAKEALKKYQPIRPEDLKTSGDIVEENRIGQRSDALAWFWRLDEVGQDCNDDWMQECKFCFWNNVFQQIDHEIPNSL